eukprot:1483291-Prymnesium_polylepis.1
MSLAHVFTRRYTGGVSARVSAWGQRRISDDLWSVRPAPSHVGHPRRAGARCGLWIVAGGGTSGRQPSLSSCESSLLHARLVARARDAPTGTPTHYTGLPRA